MTVSCHRPAAAGCSPRWSGHFVCGWSLAWLVILLMGAGCRQEQEPVGPAYLPEEPDSAPVSPSRDPSEEAGDPDGRADGRDVSSSSVVAGSHSSSSRALSPSRSTPIPQRNGAGTTRPEDPSAIGSSPRPAAFRHPLDEVPEGRLYRQALQAMDEGDLGPAEALRRELADHPQFGALAEALRAFLLARRGEFDDALQVAEQVSAIPIMRAEAYMIAGEVFRLEGRWGAAIAVFHDALKAHPDQIRAHRWLGALYHDTGAMHLSIEHLRRIAELDPDDFRSLRLAGLIHREYEKFNEAVDDYEGALTRSPPEPIKLEIQLEMARALLSLRRLDEALETLASSPESADVLALRGAILETMGEVEQGAASAERAVALAPKHAEANFVLGRVALANRDWEKASTHLQIAVDAQPTDHEPLFLLGRAMLNAGQEDEGRRHIERATELRETFLALAELHLDAMNRPSDVEVRIKLGELSEKLAWDRVALTWYQAALGLDAENRKASEGIERIRKSQRGLEPQ